jgi:hypothetical protein
MLEACCPLSRLISRVGQNHIYTVFVRYFWQGNHQIYGHIQCIYTILANPTYQSCYDPFSYTPVKFFIVFPYNLMKLIVKQLCAKNNESVR